MHAHIATRYLEDLCLLDTYPERDDPALRRNVPDLYQRVCEYGPSKEVIYHDARRNIASCEQCSVNYILHLFRRKIILNRIRQGMDIGQFKYMYQLDVLGMLN